jgi:hypothetical protein
LGARNRGGEAVAAAWSDVGQLPELSGAREIAAQAFGEGLIALAYLDENGRVRVLVFDADPLAPRVWYDIAVPGALSRHAPAAAWIDVDVARYGVDRLFGIWWRSAGKRDGVLMQAVALSPLGPYRVSAALDQAQHAIRTALGPAVTPLGTGELCGVFVDIERNVRFYCYQRESDLWIDRSALAFSSALGPQTTGHVALAYHRYRTADGDFVTGDSSRGAVFLVYTERASLHTPDNPHLLMSEWLNAEYRAFENINFRWRGSFINQWTNLAGGTGVALYEDESLISLQAIIARRDADDAVVVDYLPFADGSYDETLAAGNDFQVMERGVCAGIQLDGRCGDSAIGAF